MDLSAYHLRLSDVAEEPKKLLLPIEGYEKMPLVTLEVAVEPIIGILPNIALKVYIAKHNCGMSEGTLTLDLAAAIMLYTIGKSSDEPAFYYVLNSILRSDQPDRSEKLKPWFLYLKLFITALSYVPSYRGTVYRGVKLDLSEYYTKGKTFVWWAFSSCTKSLDILQSELFLGHEGKGTLFIIECFSGKEICKYSHYEKEDEVLLVAARHFVVVGRINPKPDLWIIQVKEIPSPFPFLKMENSISSTLEMSLVNDTNDSASVNICSQCSKTTVTVPTANAETATDDLLCNIKFNKETITYAESEEILSDEKLIQVESAELLLSKLNTYDIPSIDEMKKPEFVRVSSSSSLPLVPLVTTSNEQIDENTVSLPITDLSCMRSTTNLNTITAVEPARKNTQEKLMRFKNEIITEESAKIIAENIRQNVAVEILQFSNNSLKDEALHHIIQAIVDRSCLKVFISDNNITDIGVKSIADLLSTAPNVISQLHLDKNRITAEGVKSIVQAVSGSSNSGLKTLSFTGNLLIKDECIDDIIHFLNEKRTLKSLYLDKCDLSEDGKERLRTVISKRAAFILEI